MANNKPMSVEATTMTDTISNALFWYGRMVVAQRVMETVHSDEVWELFSRHIVGDWGEVSEAGREENERGLEVGQSLLSIYRPKYGIRVWIITSCDRSVTTVLLPDEY